MKMKRRDFNRIALGMGLGPLLANSALAQATAQTKGAPPTPPQNFNIVIKHTPRAYNQINVPRKSVAGTSIHDLLDVELSVGGQSRCNRIGQSLFNHNRGASCSMAELREAGIFGEGVSAGNCRDA